VGEPERPFGLRPRPGARRLGQGVPRPQLGHADVSEGDPELVTTGPYARIRHPIYSGVIIGAAIAVSPYWLDAVAILGAYFLFSAVIEERTMARLFPAAYPPYKRTTKMLIPYIL
jgi:protein-S-isoprenylcysteine O-methyltransferase Ste14